MTVFSMAQLDVIHFELKPVSTSLVVLALLSISLAWPVSKGASGRRGVAVAAVSLAVFAGLVLGAAEMGGRCGFLMHNRQRFLGTVATWMRPERAPSFEDVMELDGARELAKEQGTARELPPSVERGAGEGRVSLVLVVVDTWRADTLEAWGARR